MFVDSLKSGFVDYTTHLFTFGNWEFLKSLTFKLHEWQYRSQTLHSNLWCLFFSHLKTVFPHPVLHCHFGLSRHLSCFKSSLRCQLASLISEELLQLINDFWNSSLALNHLTFSSVSVAFNVERLLCQSWTVTKLQHSSVCQMETWLGVLWQRWLLFQMQFST